MNSNNNTNKSSIKDILSKRLLGLFIILIFGSSLYIFLGLNNKITFIIIIILSFFIIKNIDINIHETDYY